MLILESHQRDGQQTEQNIKMKAFKQIFKGPPHPGWPEREREGGGAHIFSISIRVLT